MSLRNGDRSRSNRLRRQKLKRRQTVAALREARTTEKPVRSSKSKRSL